MWHAVTERSVWPVYKVFAVQPHFLIRDVVTRYTGEQQTPLQVLSERNNHTKVLSFLSVRRATTEHLTVQRLRLLQRLRCLFALQQGGKALVCPQCLHVAVAVVRRLASEHLIASAFRSC